MRAFVAGLDRAALERRCDANRSPGYPADPRKYLVKQCMWIVLNEEWEHHRFVVRDLEPLESVRRRRV